MITTAVAVAVTTPEGSIVPNGKVVALPGRNLQLLDESTTAETDIDCAALLIGQDATMHTNAVSASRKSVIGVASDMDPKWKALTDIERS